MNVIAEGNRDGNPAQGADKGGLRLPPGTFSSPTLEEDAPERFIGNDMNGSYSVISQEKSGAVKPAGEEPQTGRGAVCPGRDLK